MSCLENPNYIREFIYRTKLNYYRNMYLYGNEKDKYIKLINELESQMKSEKYVVEEFYEVTALINSMIGMLIFPEQNLYKQISNKEDDLKRLFPTLYECTQYAEYVNTYGNNSPREIIKHIRNACSHQRVLIYPMERKDENKISKIILQDSCNKAGHNNTKNFSIEIPVELLEKVIMEICDYALSVSK